MSLFRDGIVRVSERLLARPFSVDHEVSLGFLLGRMLGAVLGLFRGLVFARRFLIMESGASISDSRRLKTAGGIVRLGAHSRIECTSRNGVKLGRNFKLGAFSRMVASGTLSDLGVGIIIGDNVGVSEYAYIGGAGGVIIGSDVIIGQYFSIHPENHNFEDSQTLIREQGVSRAGVKIGSNCWIGAKVTILDGVSLGPGCVVAAGSVVNRSFPENSVIGGVPSRILRHRALSTTKNLSDR